jgi:hypothetical protein
VNNCRDNVQDLGFSSIWYISLVVKEDRVKQGRHHAVVDHLEVVGFFDIDIHKLQDFFLDRSETSNLGSLGCNVAFVKSVSTHGCPTLKTHHL